jgi:hypothetical protein
MGVKILDAGGKLVLSSERRDEVEVALAKYGKRGSKSVAEIQRIGASWVAACTLPIKESDLDTTSTLQLSDVVDYGAKPASPEPEFSDGCRVEEIGFKRIVTGPSKRAVELRLEHLKQFGAELVGNIEEDGGNWVAVVDTGGADKTYKY